MKFEIKDEKDAAKFIESLNSVRRPMNSKRVRNLEVQKKMLVNTPEVKRFREGLVRQFGFDPVVDIDRFPASREGFQWGKFKESLHNQMYSRGKFSEADTSSAFSQFLKAGLQQIVNALYETTETTYEDWVTVINSTRASEPYAPNHGVSFPRQVGGTEKYPEVAAAALDSQLRNYKYGSIYAVEQELLEDDQTGTFQRQAGVMGEYAKVLYEALCYGKLASVANMQYDQYRIPQSETQPSNESTWPYTATGLQGGGKNRPSAFTVLTQAALQNGIIGLMNMLNLHGLKMTVRPDRLVLGPELSFDAAILLNSSYYPSGAASAGVPGGAFAINPIKGVADLTVSRFIFKEDGTVTGNSKAWYLMDDKKPWFILQIREPITVVQEAINSGKGFSQDIIRFKGRSRGNADHIDPRFVWQGNDGSVTS